MSEQLNEILDIVCTYHQVEIEEVRGPSRNKEFVNARQMFCNLAKKLTRHTVSNIGKKINMTMKLYLKYFQISIK